MDRPFHSGQEIEISISGTKVIGFGSWAQILVESGPRVRLRLAKNIRKIVVSKVGARVMVHDVWTECEPCFGLGVEQ